MKKKAFGLIALAVAVIALFVLFFPRMGNKVPSSDVHNLYSIGAILSRYQSTNKGRLPSRLSDLVPNYIGYTNIQLFFWPPKPWAITNLNPESLSHEIDKGGAFIYLGERGLLNGIILYEQTNLWLKHDGAIILRTNFAVERLSRSEIQRRLSNLPQQ